MSHVHVERVDNGFLLDIDGGGIAVVEGTNPRTVAAKLGRAVIRGLDIALQAEEEGPTNE